jgi:hypothetical protein
MSCGCGVKGFGRAFGADEPVVTTPAFDPAALGQLVQSDAQGRVQWKPQIADIILKQAGSQWIAQDYFSEVPVGGRMVRVVIARAQTENPGVAPASWPTGSEPVKADEYLAKMAGFNYNACASYGWVVPTTEVEKLLVHIPVGDPETLRVVSVAAPILSASPADMLAQLEVPSKGGWAGLSTGKKVAVLGGGGLLVAAATGLLGAKWKIF